MVRSRFAWLKSTKIRVAPFLLPPGGGDLVRHPPLQFAGGGDHGMPHVEELAGGFDRREHMQPPVAGGLDEGLQPGLGQHGPQFLRGRNRVLESGAGLRVQVDPELVGVVRVAGPRRPGVEDHGVHLHRPDRGGDLVNHELGMRAAARVDHHDRAHEVRGALGGFFEKNCSPSTVAAEPLERHGTVAVRRQESVPDVDDVPGEVQLGEPELRPQHPAGAGDPQLPRLRWGCSTVIVLLPWPWGQGTPRPEAN